MPWRMRRSVEMLLRLTPAVLGSTVFSIAGLCAAHECLDDGALLSSWPRARPSAPACRRWARSTPCCSPSSSSWSGWLLTCEPFALHAFLTASLAGALSHVLYVVEDLDDCFAGGWQVSPQPFARARAYMNRAPVAPEVST